MANTEQVAGVGSYLLYGEETTFGTAVTTDTHFGYVTNLSPTLDNSNTYRRSFVGTTTGGRDVAKILPGVIKNSATIDFDVLNWTFMEFVLGTATGTDPFTYTGANAPASITLSRSIDNVTTDRDEIWAGTAIDSITIKASVGEPVSVSMNILSANHQGDTTVATAVALPTEDVYSFSGADIELPNATPLTNIIDSLEITISNNYEMLYGLGSRRGQNAKAKARDYKISFTVNNKKFSPFCSHHKPLLSVDNKMISIQFSLGCGPKKVRPAPGFRQCFCCY